MAMSNATKDLLKRPSLKGGFFRGYVVDNNDPLKRQRVRIRIPQLHRGIPDEHLPWSMPVSTGNSHAGSGVGSVYVPPKGALIEGFFEEDDPHNFRIAGSPPVDSVNKDNELLQEDYPHTEGHVDEGGNKWSVNKLRNEVLFQHKSGATIFIDGSGNIQLSAKGRLSLNGAQGIDLVSGGDLKIHAPQGTDIKGAPIDLNGSSAAQTSSNPPARTTPNIPSPAGKTSL